jgi:modified peptide precursor CbpA
VVLITFDLEVHPRQIRIEDLINVKKPVKQIIAFRKACKASGTGLSHYILMETKPKK